MNFQSGQVDGKDWFCGTVPVSKKKTVYVDTRSGEGVETICKMLEKFITFQSSKVKLPCSSKEDIAQDIYILVLEAMPKYNINKNTNMLTFLQGHVQKRLINKYKYVSEKKRRATYYNTSTYKVRCPSCKNFSILRKKDILRCEHCGFQSQFKGWKKYNLPVTSLPFTYIEDKITDSEGEDGASNLDELLSEEYKLSYFLGEAFYGLELGSQKRMDFLKIFNKLDEISKSIINMLLEGYAYKEVACQMGISEKATYARVAKIINSNK